MAYTKECPNCHTNADNFDDDNEFESHVERCKDVKSHFNSKLDSQLYAKPRTRSARAGK
jgi:hypothetical protein